MGSDSQSTNENLLEFLDILILFFVSTCYFNAFDTISHASDGSPQPVGLTRLYYGSFRMYR